MKDRNLRYAFYVIFIALPILLFHTFYGDAGFNWDALIEKGRKKTV